MKKQIIKDTAEYNYNLGYLKALDEVEKIIENLIKQLPEIENRTIAYNQILHLKDNLKKLREK